MATCKKCGARKHRWPRSCSRCRSGVADKADKGETAMDAAELATEVGLLGWIARGFMAVVRMALRAIG
ncbi:hypothetical protein HET64_02380 [Streptomyces sp. McG3]|nr:hypothetical protein [Streptomyces sp. McG3]